MDPRDYVQNNGVLDLVTLVSAAHKQRMRIIFLAEWDGSLAMGLALAVLSSPGVPISRPLSIACRPHEQRSLNGWSGEYKDYYAYALEHREMQLLEECLRLG
eukprot:436859-Pyramimonas_sp.AAC.1